MNAGIAFPQTASPQTFPLNGAQNTATKTQTFPLAFQELRPRVYEFRPLVGFEFDGGTRRYGYEGHAGATDFYSPKVLSIGEIYKEVPQLWGLYSISSTTITLDNNDKEFSVLKATEPFKNRVGWVALCEPYYGEASIHRLFTGIIDYWAIQGGRISITLKDGSGIRLKQMVSQFALCLNVTDFPYLPSYQPRALVPIVLGGFAILSDQTVAQPFPSYLVDPAAGQAYYKYVWNQHEGFSSGSGNWIYGQLDAVAVYASTVLTGQPGPTGSLSVLLYTNDPRDFPTHSPLETEVRIGALGEGTLPTTYAFMPGNAFGTVGQPATVVECLYAFLDQWGIIDPATEMDDTAWQDAMTAEHAISTYDEINATLAITNRDETIEDVIAKACETILGHFYVDKNGLFVMRIAWQDDVTGIAISDSSNIIADSFRVTSNPNACSTLQYNYNYNFVDNYFQNQEDLHDAVEETNLGEDIRANRNLWYYRPSPFAADTTLFAAKAMESMTENTQLVSFSIPIRYHAAIDVTKLVTLTHFEGIDSSGLGYDAVTVRILSVRFNPHPSASSIAVTGIVVI